MNVETAEQQKKREENLRAAIRHALNKEAIVFLGAGAAKSAKSAMGTTLPTGQELSDILAAECGLNSGYPLDSISEHFLEAKSETTLINALRKHLHVTKIDDELVALASVPWSRIWTTNYDDAFEQALDVHKTSYYSLTTAAEVRNAQGNKLILMHINGALKNLNHSLPPDFVLTSQSYATQSFVDSEWSVIFRNDLQRVKAIIFVGYSLADIDVARLIFNPDIVRNKIHFIDRDKIDPVQNTKLSRFGTVHPIGLTAFSRILREEQSTWVPPNLVEEYQCYSRLIIDKEPLTPSDDYFYDLILRGVTRDQLMLAQSETPNNPDYTVIRDCEAECISTLGQTGRWSRL